MRLTLATALMLAAASLATVAAAPAARAADAGPWQWQPATSVPASMPAMAADGLRSHVGGWVYAADGSVVGSLDSFTKDGEAVIHAGMFFMGDMKYLVVPGRNLAVMDGRVYVHSVDADHVRKVVTPTNLAVGL